MDTNIEKQAERAPLSVRLTCEEWELLDELRHLLGFSTRSQVIKRLIKTAHVRPASVKFAQPEAQQN